MLRIIVGLPTPPSPPPPILLIPLQNAKSSFPPREFFKLLLGYQYGHIIVRRIHAKVIRCVKIFWH